MTVRTTTKIKDKCFDYLRRFPNLDDLDKIKAIVKGEESNFTSSQYTGGKKNKANRTGNETEEKRSCHTCDKRGHISTNCTICQ